MCDEECEWQWMMIEKIDAEQNYMRQQLPRRFAQLVKDMEQCVMRATTTAAERECRWYFEDERTRAIEALRNGTWK
jgi:hypothetical protein